jgi:hypothetical protein
MKRVAGLAIVLSAVALLAVAASAAEGDALGTWDVVTATPEGPMASVLTITRTEGKLKAEVDLGGVKRTVSDEAIEGDVLKLKVDYEGVVYSLQAKIAGATMEGTWEGGGNSGTLTATRRP